MAPLVEGSERVRTWISLAIESQSVPDKGRDARPEGPANRARKARENGSRVSFRQGCIEKAVTLFLWEIGQARIRRTEVRPICSRNTEWQPVLCDKLLSLR